MAIAIDMARPPTTVTNIVTTSQPPPTDNIRSKADKTKSLSLPPYQRRKHNYLYSPPTDVKQILAAYDLCRLGLEELESSKPF
jgi:hypothetical protein